MLARCIVVMSALVLIAAESTSAGVPGKIEGRILDGTCFGPCVIGMEPAPYTGEGKVVVTRLPKDRRVDAFTPDPDGSFEVRLPPGRYKLEVRIEDPCFEEDVRVLRVSRGGDVDRPDFLVYNTCIK